MNRIFLSPPDLSQRERSLLLDAFDSNWITTLGPHITAFEKEICQRTNVSHAAALSSGTAALHLALLVLGVRSGDEVISSDLTFAATANAITYCGARPVFIGSDPATWNMDPGLLSEELAECARCGKMPKAVIVVDLFGQCADYESILAVCQEYELPVIEDAAEALGATCGHRAAGSLGRMGIVSFNGNKIITTGGGGMLLSDDELLIEKARFLATQARDPAPWYQHSTIGYNYRLSNLLAAVGRGQLESLDTKVAKRREINRFYQQALADLPGIGFMPEAPYGKSNRWLTCITIDPNVSGLTSKDVRIALEAEDIESRPVWKPMHLQPVFGHIPYRGNGFDEHVFTNGLCLPSGSNLTEEDLERIVTVIFGLFGRQSHITEVTTRITQKSPILPVFEKPAILQLKKAE